MKTLGKGLNESVSIAIIQGIAVAQSLFNSSLNYHSVVLSGCSKFIEDCEKVYALEKISSHLMPGRNNEARPLTEKEINVTAVVEMSIEEISAKVRKGPPEDNQADIKLPIRAGVLDFSSFNPTIYPDHELKGNIAIPASVHNRKDQIISGFLL